MGNSVFVRCPQFDGHAGDASYHHTLPSPGEFRVSGQLHTMRGKERRHAPALGDLAFSCGSGSSVVPVSPPEKEMVPVTVYCLPWTFLLPPPWHIWNWKNKLIKSGVVCMQWKCTARKGNDFHHHPLWREEQGEQSSQSKGLFLLKVFLEQ